LLHRYRALVDDWVVYESTAIKTPTLVAHFQQYTIQSNVVVLKPEILKAFPTVEGVNKAMANMVAFSEATQSLLEVKGIKGVRRKAP